MGEPEMMASWLQDMYLWPRFSSKAARLLIREQGLDSPERLSVHTDKNVDDICNVLKKQGGKNANRTPDRGQQVQVIAQENLKAVFLFYLWWTFTFDWEVMGVQEGTIHLLTGQKRFKDKYKDPNMLLEINKFDMAGTMEAIKEYLRSHDGVVRVPLAYIIRETIIVKIYGNYLIMLLLMVI